MPWHSVKDTKKKKTPQYAKVVRMHLQHADVLHVHGAQAKCIRMSLSVQQLQQQHEWQHQAAAAAVATTKTQQG